MELSKALLLLFLPGKLKNSLKQSNRMVDLSKGVHYTSSIFDAFGKGKRDGKRSDA